MNFEREIRKITEYLNSQTPKPKKKTEQVIESIISNTCESLHNRSYDFSQMIHINLKQDGKIRKIKVFQPFSPEEILCIFLKRILDRKFHVNYPNRNQFMHSLFDVTNSLKDMNDFTIFRFDFEDFFNSVSAPYVFHKYISTKSFERWELDLIKEYTAKTKYTYAGLNTSNILCEIIASAFDDVLIQQFGKYGLIYYKRYIDDGIIIFNQYIAEDRCVELINSAIQIVFLDDSFVCTGRCKTKLNLNKLNYIAKREMVSTGTSYEFDFLGYLFILSNDKNKAHLTSFQYGLTKNKLAKYRNRINTIISDYSNSPQRDMELLRHQIKCFCFRTVYQVTRYKTVIWKSKGLISNYCELGLRMEYLTKDTRDFLKNAVFDAFRQNGVDLPYFLRGVQDQSCYNLYNNFKNNRSLLFVQMIGIHYDTLAKMCKQVGISVSSQKTYDDLLRDYLIKVKVGH